MSAKATAVILAAGQGTRMKSHLPKVLHEIAGLPLVAWVIEAAFAAGIDDAVIVTGFGRERVETVLGERYGDRVRFALQAEQNGTGHAVQCAIEQQLADFEGKVFVLMGDCPLIESQTLEALKTAGDAETRAALVVAPLADPTGYGRMLREDGKIVGIREHKDCTPAQLAIREVNPALYAFDAKFLRDSLGKLDTNNAQGELYLTDVIAMAAETAPVADVTGDMRTLLGVNDRLHLAVARETLQARINEAHARAGVGIRDPRNTYIDAGVALEADCTIEPGVHLRGATKIAAGAVIDAGAVLTNVEVAAGAHVLPYTVATDTLIGEEANVGPFTHLRPGTKLGKKSKVGNFSETKKTILGDGSKVNHLAYVGDGQIGEGVNVGAGVIFCNYDGVRKHTTVLEDGVFVGSDSQIVAPVTVGKGAYVASGSTVTRDVPADALAVSRTKQQNKEGYAARLRARFAAEKKRLEEEKQKG